MQMNGAPSREEPQIQNVINCIVTCLYSEGNVNQAFATIFQLTSLLKENSRPWLSFLNLGEQYLAYL